MGNCCIYENGQCIHTSEAHLRKFNHQDIEQLLPHAPLIGRDHDGRKVVLVPCHSKKHNDEAKEVARTIQLQSKDLNFQKAREQHELALPNHRSREAFAEQNLAGNPGSAPGNTFAGALREEMAPQGNGGYQVKQNDMQDNSQSVSLYNDAGAAGVRSGGLASGGLRENRGSVSFRDEGQAYGQERGPTSGQPQPGGGVFSGGLRDMGAPQGATGFRDAGAYNNGGAAVPGGQSGWM
mmetsp:Transcript_3609/g.8500  ORF Transcript_3609/g.8500 Transcript_3609/m.8500 type:complete len:237 (-) Transcript_3609:165-875(-)